ncbi:glycosyltransferase family 2 protein [Faecalitalea cylindroides]|uniref:glycosyltransferase n=1 Tax=Faecalitalea cylindroides TaxID=39483 RepID=UPI001957BC76|nr:glycosyltransferase family 2 protein [Faecalitalea cylindroides]
MRNEAVLAGIVTYNPDIERLKLNLDAIYNQVSEVTIIDNGSCNTDEIVALTQKYNNIYIVCNKRNKGIAAALNQIGDIAVERKKDYFLTLDQDSIADDSLIAELYSVFSDIVVGVSCPYINRKNDFIASSGRKKVKVAITSGAMIRTSVWREIGGFWEYLFIDEVDHEFCYQVRRKGYSIFQINTVAINHIIGKPFSKRVLGHQFNPTNHSPFRRYYIARNDVIMQHLFPDEKEPFSNRYQMLLRIVISILLCEEDKFSKIGAIFRGVKDAVAWNIQNKEISERRETS